MVQVDEPPPIMCETQKNLAPAFGPAHQPLQPLREWLSRGKISFCFLFLLCRLLLIDSCSSHEKWSFNEHFNCVLQIFKTFYIFWESFQSHKMPWILNFKHFIENTNSENTLCGLQNNFSTPPQKKAMLYFTNFSSIFLLPEAKRHALSSLKRRLYWGICFIKTLIFLCYEGHMEIQNHGALPMQFSHLLS